MENGQAPDAIESLLPPEHGSLEKEINHHLTRCKPLRIPFDDASVRRQIRISPAPEYEVAVRLADLAIGARHFEEANVHLARARALAPDAPLVLEEMARLELSQNNPDRAVELYRQAIAAGSSKPSAFLASAKSRLKAAMTGTQNTAGAGGIPAEKALEEIRHVLVLDPGRSDAYLMLGRALYMVKNVSAADADALNPGFAATADGMWVRYLRALIFKRLG